MRDTIRTKLVDEISELEEVYQPSVPDANSKKPYAVVKMEADVRTELRHSFDKVIEVWVYTTRKDFNDLDSIVSKCIEALTAEELETNAGKLFSLECIGVSGDGYTDPELKAVTKRIDFNYSFIRRF